MNLARELYVALQESPGQSAAELRSRLRDVGLDVDRKQINRLLYSSPHFVNDGAACPSWRTKAVVLVQSTREPAPPPAARQPAIVDSAPGVLQLRPWQHRALQAWRRNGSRGIVQAVTGTGKTHVGLAAIEHEVADGGSALVLVPTIELLEQWQERIQTDLPRLTVGLLGGGHRSARTEDVIVCVINTARLADFESVLRTRTLLVADECHGYGAAQNSLALRATHRRRLGLTATLERLDDGVDARLNPYFGSVVFDYTYADAVRDGDVIAPFRVALVGVALDSDERRAYDRFDASMRKAFGVLAGSLGHPPTLEDIAGLAKSEDYSSREVQTARRWMKNRSDRAELVAACRGKTTIAHELAPLLAERKSIVFVDRTATADQVATRFRNAGLRASSLHSKLDRRTRRALLTDFKQGHTQLLVAPRVLDEGVDVPDADTAIILSASSTRRQMVQRMGRVLRRKPDGATAHFVIVYATSTHEDPATGSRHEGFLKLVTEPAEAVQTFHPRDTEALLAFLGTRRTDGGTPTQSRPPLTLVAPADSTGPRRERAWRPSFLSKMPRHPTGDHEPRHAVREDRRLTVPSYQPANVCSGCNGTISPVGHCRCS